MKPISYDESMSSQALGAVMPSLAPDSGAARGELQGETQSVPSPGYSPQTQAIIAERDTFAANAAATKAELGETQQQLLYWRTIALRNWADALADAEAQPSKVEELTKQVEDLQRALAEIQGTVSWRVTTPLRSARTVAGMAKRRVVG